MDLDFFYDVSDDERLSVNSSKHCDWRLANETEDSLIELIDVKTALTEILFARSVPEEIWWLVKTFFFGSEDLKEVLESRGHLGVNESRLLLFMKELGFGKRKKLFRMLNFKEKFFVPLVSFVLERKEAKKLQCFPKICDMIELQRGKIILTNRKERKMAKKSNGTLLGKLPMKEIKEVAKIVGHKVTVKKAEEAAKVLHAFIKDLPADKGLEEKAEKWYAVCDMILQDEVETLEEARERADREYAELLAEATKAAEEALSPAKPAKKKKAAKEKAAKPAKEKPVKPTKDVPYPQYVGKDPVGPDEREKEFPLGSKVAYTGDREKGLEFFGGPKSKAEVVGYHKWPMTGIVVKNKDGKKSAFTPNALK